jgi:type IV secretory pathway VirB6-like protein
MLKIFRKQNYMKNIHSKLLIILLLVGCLSFNILYSHNAYAATTATHCTADKDGIENPEYSQTNITIISDVVMTIKVRLIGVTTAMYLFTTSNWGFIAAIQVTLTLYIIVYGISFMTGLISIKLHDFIIRLIKIAVIVSLIGPGSWYFFNRYLINFFDGIVDEIILYITVGALPKVSVITSTTFLEIISPILNSFTSGQSVFLLLDQAVGKIFSAKTIVGILALFTSTAYGKFYALILMISLWSFMRSLMTAMWVYIMSIVVRTILIGLAPIFIPTIMFQRTRHIFDGWLSQLISSALQPILLFVFFMFFIRLMQGTMDSIFVSPICFAELPKGWSGTAFDFSFWQFAVRDPTLGWTNDPKAIKLSSQSNAYPVNEMAIYTFLLVSEIANRFNGVVIQIAAQIAQATSSFIGTSPTDQIKESFINKRATGGRGITGGRGPIADSK